MKTDDLQLRNRGFLADGFENEYLDIDSKQLLLLLTSGKPIDRSLAARLIGRKQDLAFIKPLGAALCNERKLYSKLEICNALVGYGEDSVTLLTSLLGEIGNNQHKFIAEKPFKKDSYPLPRDIAARCLIRVGLVAMPELFSIVRNGKMDVVSEAIDAIGFIHFYEPMPTCFDLIIECFDVYQESELIKWKCVRALSGCSQARVFLLKLEKIENNRFIQQEIARSLRLIGLRNIV